MSTPSTNEKINVRDLSFVGSFSLIVGSMMGSGVFDVPQNVAHGAGSLFPLALVGLSCSWGLALVGHLRISNQRPDIQSGIYGYTKTWF